MDKYECRRLRLLELRDTRCNGVAAELAEKLDRSASYVSRMLYPEGKPGKKRIADEMNELIEKAFKLPAGWLSLPPGDEQDSSTEPGFSNVVPITLIGQPLPLLDYAQARLFAMGSTLSAMGGGFEFIVASIPVSERSFALKLTGMSMYPRFHPGDLVIIDPDVTPAPGRFVVANNGENEATFKKYRPRGLNDRGDPLIELVPLNDDFPAIRSDVSPFQIIGTMVEHRSFLMD